MSHRSHFIPPPRWAITRWLTAPARPLDAEGRSELRAGMFRRMEALVASSAVNIGIAAICYAQKPTWLFLCWLIIDVAWNVLRVIIFIAISRNLKKHLPTGTVRADIVDCFIITATISSALVGIGAGLYTGAGDPVMGVYGSILAVATIGAQSAKNPASPRLIRIQMSLVIIPFAVCTLLSPLPALHWLPLLTMFYLVGMFSINRELHADYVAMIEARIENRRRALHCSLTGLPNRAFVQQNVTTALQDARAGHRSVAILLLDLDGFKSVNDALGHPMGDVLLKLVARRIGSVVPEASMPARIGGDEFAIFMPDGDRAGCEALAQALITALRNPFTLGNDVVEIGVSIGIVLGGHNAAETFDDLFARADRALYAAKRAGKGMFRWHEDLSSAPVELVANQAQDRSVSMHAA